MQQSNASEIGERIENIIEVHELTKVFKGTSVETKALDGVNISIKSGDFVSLEGPSGCGKSTLLSILALLDEPTSGRLTLSGINVDNIGFKEKLRVRNKYIGVVYQAFNLIPTMTVLENIILPLTFYKTCSYEEAKLRAIAIISKVGLEDKVFHKPDMLSGGQQQRVAIARALITEPSIILADEPTGNLDSKNASSIINIFKELNEKGQTILMVTHDNSLAKQSKTRLSMLDGKIL
jgi:putative ABC transport system ATP-binding protein